MAPKPRNQLKVEWATVDWSLRNIEIARERGISRKLVRQHRLKLFPTPKSQKPGHVVLEPTVKLTAGKYGVSYLEARQWHQAEAQPVHRGRPKFVLPPEFVPATLEADAKRLGVHLHTVAAAMKREGIARGQAGRKRGPAPFVLPADYLPGVQQEESKRGFAFFFLASLQRDITSNMESVSGNKLP